MNVRRRDAISRTGVYEVRMPCLEHVSFLVAVFSADSPSLHACAAARLSTWRWEIAAAEHRKES